MKMKIANIIFLALGVVVLICGVLNILNPILGHFQFYNFAVAYFSNGSAPPIPVVAIGLIAVGLGMIIKGIEDFRP